MKSLITVLLLFPFCLFSQSIIIDKISGDSVEIQLNEIEYAKFGFESKMKDNVIIIPAEDYDYLVIIDSSYVVIDDSYSKCDSIDEGTIMLFEGSDEYPWGFLRKVVYI